jgi:hypothetical protein
MARDHERILGELSEILRDVRARGRAESRALERLESALEELRVRNSSRLERETELLKAYEALREELTPAERDAFFRGILGDVKRIADAGRLEMKELVEHRLEERSTDAAGARTPTRRTPDRDGTSPEAAAPGGRREPSAETSRRVALERVVRGRERESR